MAEVQRQLLEAPPRTWWPTTRWASYELAAIHLSQEDPHSEAAQLAIDGMAALVEKLRSARRGRAHPSGCANQIRLAFMCR